MEELEQAYESGLVLDSMIGNWTQPTTRLLAAEAIVRLTEFVCGGTIDQIAEWSNYDLSDGFSDTDSKAASFLKAAGISVGVGNNNYNPDGLYTRAEMVTMLGRMYEKGFLTWGISGSQLGSVTFTDVPEWADKYIGWAVEAEVTNGMSDDLFGSDMILENQQTAIFILRSGIRSGMYSL